jgi:hypothetical protein
VVEAGGVSLLAALLRAPHAEIREQAITALVALAMHHPRIRDAVIAAGAHAPCRRAQC